MTGKTVISFSTSGGSDIGNTDVILQRSAKAANRKLGKRMRPTPPLKKLPLGPKV